MSSEETAPQASLFLLFLFLSLHDNTTLSIRVSSYSNAARSSKATIHHGHRLNVNVNASAATLTPPLPALRVRFALRSRQCVYFTRVDQMAADSRRQACSSCNRIPSPEASVRLAEIQQGPLHKWAEHFCRKVSTKFPGWALFC